MIAVAGQHTNGSPPVDEAWPTHRVAMVHSRAKALVLRTVKAAWLVVGSVAGALESGKDVGARTSPRSSRRLAGVT